MLESEKVKINEFKDVYSSIDSKIYKLKVNSWLDSNRNNLIDFNNEISMKSHIYAFTFGDKDNKILSNM